MAVIVTAPDSRGVGRMAPPLRWPGPTAEPRFRAPDEVRPLRLPALAQRGLREPEDADAMDT